MVIVVELMASCSVDLTCVHASTTKHNMQERLVISTLPGVAHDRRRPRALADVGHARLLLGRARMAQGDVATARIDVAAAVQALRQGVGPEHPWTREAAAMAAH